MANQKINMNTVWFKDAKGEGRIKSDNLQTQIAIPAPKGGSGDGAEPQQLLISSAVACYTMTLAYMLDKSKVPVSGFFMDTEGDVAPGDQLSITHRPHVVLKSDATKDHVNLVENLVLKAEENCHIGQLLIKAGVPVATQGTVSIDNEDDLTSNYIEENGFEW
ncbi:osmotically inducible protein OsmC [Paenibacillus taichungensis]|uniref:Osmotically inducible protein OsmC n=1 Tax=Paenibacillus taichungensis TaxID=484184 RepID=A0ABX2MS85_9BACL|nr:MULTISPECIES: OsmC family protein [Paenibacillus]NUU56954.1 osmotically inducible protein OsmC [Paenibacillus taichungensis]PIH60275.1 osmotically inducible protein OsmC [Paenibacillus sp. LK1]